MNVDARWSLGALVPATAITIAIAWGNLERLPGVWIALLVFGTMSAVLGLALVAGGRLAVGGLAILVSAFMLPTGFAFILNAVLGCLGLALAMVGVRDRETA